MTGSQWRTIGAVLETGVDIVEIERVADLAQRYGERFGRRVYSPDEWQAFRGQKHTPLQRRGQKNERRDASKTGGIGRRGISLRFRAHQPPRKFFFEIACEVHSKLCARVQTQRVAVCAIEH